MRCVKGSFPLSTASFSPKKATGRSDDCQEEREKGKEQKGRPVDTQLFLDRDTATGPRDVDVLGGGERGGKRRAPNTCLLRWFITWFRSLLEKGGERGEGVKREFLKTTLNYPLWQAGRHKAKKKKKKREEEASLALFFILPFAAAVIGRS